MAAPKTKSAKATKASLKDENVNFRDEKKTIIKKYQVHEKDNGSAHVQIAILTERIAYLTDHLKKHPKDDHSRRGLLMMVGKRRKLLNFLKKKSKEDFAKLISALGLRH